MTYGIPLAQSLVGRYGLTGLELLLSWLPTARSALARLPAGAVAAIHLPWSWRFSPWGWNGEVGFAANLKGKLQYLSQAGTQYSLRAAEELGVEYAVVHPGAFACFGGKEPLEELRGLAGLAFENDWAGGVYISAEAALHFSDWTGAGVVIDTCHLARLEHDSKYATRIASALASRVVAVHVSDYDRERGEHLIPRWGNEAFKPLPEVLDVVRGYNPNIPMVIEVLEGTPEEAVEETLAYLSR